MMKSLTREQLQSRKERAVRFTRDVRNDPERAEEIEDESLEDYAERRKMQIANPCSRRTVIMPAGQTKAELEAEIADLQAENTELADQLDAIADIVSPDEDEEDEDAESSAFTVPPKDSSAFASTHNRTAFVLASRNLLKYNGLC